MAMLAYPCMEESCVCTVPASRSIAPLRYVRTASESTWRVIKRKKKKRKEKQAPTVNSSVVLFFFLLYIISNDSMVIYRAEEF